MTRLFLQTNAGRQSAASPVALNLRAGTKVTAVRGKLGNGEAVEGVGLPDSAG